MNILLVHCRYRIAGGEDEVAAGDRRLLEKMGHTVHTLYRSNEELDGMGAIGRLRSTLGYVYSASAGKEYVKLIRERSIDAVWVHNTLWMIGGAIYEAAAECGVPVIQTVHNYRMLCPCGTMYRNGKICRECLYEGLHKAVIHRCYRGSGILSLVLTLAMMRQRRSGIYRDIRFVCLTDLQKKMLLEVDIGIRDDGVYIKHNHCETPMRWIPYDERKNCFVYAGRLAENKGIRELLEAWRRLEKEVYINRQENCPQLVICGDGELADYVAGYIRKNELNYVNYAGKIQRDRLAGILSEARALIYPTKWLEGQPMAIVEAYSVGTPVIASDLGNAGAMVDEGRTGKHIAPDDMIGSLVDIIRSADVCSFYDETAMRKKAELYSTDSAVKAIEAILEGLPAKRQGVNRS